MEMYAAQKGPFTVEMFDEPHHPKWKRGRIIPQEELKDERKSIVYHTFHDRKNREDIVFFSTDHCYRLGIMPEAWVPCSLSLPWRVAPRPGFEDGLVQTAEDLARFLKYCHPKTTFLYSVEELVNYLNRDSDS